MSELRHGSGSEAQPERELLRNVAPLRPRKNSEDSELQAYQCIWCEQEEVTGPGLTCSIDCYFLWWAHYNRMATEGVIILPDDTVPPRLIHEQPWY